MANRFTQVQNPIKVVAKCANTDHYWGPYTSVAEAISTLGRSGADMIVSGRKFGVSHADGTTIEYEFTQTDNPNAYRKVGNGGSSVKEVEIEGSIEQRHDSASLVLQLHLIDEEGNEIATSEPTDISIQNCLSQNVDGSVRVGLMLPVDKDTIYQSIALIDTEPSPEGAIIKVKTNKGDTINMAGIPNATQENCGVMSANDKRHLDENTEKILQLTGISDSSFFGIFLGNNDLDCTNKAGIKYEEIYGQDGEHKAWCLIGQDISQLKLMTWENHEKFTIWQDRTYNFADFSGTLQKVEQLEAKTLSVNKGTSITDIL